MGKLIKQVSLFLITLKKGLVMKTWKVIPTLLFCTLFFFAVNVSAKVKPPTDLISWEKAEVAAQVVHTGKIEKKALEPVHGKWVYTFDIKGIDNGVHVVKIDAKTGDMISHDTEKAKQEAVEKKAEEKNEKK